MEKDNRITISLTARQRGLLAVILSDWTDATRDCVSDGTITEPSEIETQQDATALGDQLFGLLTKLKERSLEQIVAISNEYGNGIQELKDTWVGLDPFDPRRRPTVQALVELKDIGDDCWDITLVRIHTLKEV